MPVSIQKVILLATIVLTLCTGLSLSALAIDPGRVQGTLQVNGQAITLTRAYAHLHDNAEKVLDRPRELRLLLVDREVPQEILAGLDPQTALAHLARDGRLQGLLFKLDPDNHRRLEVAVLYPPPAPGSKLLTQTIANSGPNPALKLSLHPQRVGGTVEIPPAFQSNSGELPNLSYSLHFSAPLFHELPVTAVLVGRAAQTSAQVKVLRAKARALEQGDFTAVQRLSTARAYQETKTLPAPAGPDANAWAKQEAAKLQASLKHLQRVVVRSNRAVAVFTNKPWQTFVREDGQWKTDN